ncbi:hypothetical protein ACIQMY_20715 [Streptomyces sp. NPDC091368]|uniref:hypothetical protein n=1 Tax=Streptomyces sp. NPDC091368 TaxID=3365993 RepID=UPI00381073D1
MTLTIELPVTVRVGDGPEAELGVITVPGRDGVVDLAALRVELARFYRALADEIETLEEVDDAAP